MHPKDVEIRYKRVKIQEIIDRLNTDKIAFETTPKRVHSEHCHYFESLLIRIPQEPFVFIMRNEDEWHCHNGNKRLISLMYFVLLDNCVFESPVYYKDLEGLTFKQMPGHIQRRIMETEVTALLVFPTSEEIVEDLRNRL